MTTCRGLPNPHTHTHTVPNILSRVSGLSVTCTCAHTRALHAQARSLCFSPRRSTPSSPSPIERRHPSRSALHQCEASTRLGLFRFFLSLSLSPRCKQPIFSPLFGTTFRPPDRYPLPLPLPWFLLPASDDGRAFTRIDSRFAAAAFPSGSASARFALDKTRDGGGDERKRDDSRNRARVGRDTIYTERGYILSSPSPLLSFLLSSDFLSSITSSSRRISSTSARDTKWWIRGATWIWNRGVNIRLQVYIRIYAVNKVHVFSTRCVYVYVRARVCECVLVELEA